MSGCTANVWNVLYSIIPLFFSQDPRTEDCAIFIQRVVPGSTAEKVTLFDITLQY